MVNTEIITVGYKIYIITTTADEIVMTTVGKCSKIEKRKFKSWSDIPFQERSKIDLAKALRTLQEQEKKR